MTEKNTTEETVAEVQQIFADEAKGGEPVAPDYNPPEAQAPAETKGDEKAVASEPEKVTEQLYAGKYKTPEEMATGYQELQTAHNTQTAKIAEQESALGVAAKDRESHKKFLDVVANADPENVQTAILQHLKDSGQVAFDADVLDPKVALHLASVMNPVVQELRDGLAELRAGKGAEAQAEAKAEYEEKFPYMADAAVQGEVDKAVADLRAKSPDGQISGDDLAAVVLRIGRDAGLRETSVKAALDSRTGADAPAAADRATDPKPKQTKGEFLVDAIYGNAKEGIASVGEQPPDFA